MKTLEVCFCVVLSLFQLTSSQEASCGEARVVQVSDETRNDSRLHFPWAGVLFNVANESTTGAIRYLCGATLVSEVFCVTAAHCIHEKKSSFRRLPNQVALFFGIYDLRRIESSKGSSAVAEISLHPDWDPLADSYDADIALLRLSKPVEYSKQIKPICLWPRQSDFARGTVVSWTDAGEDDPGYWNHDHDPLHNYPNTFDMPIRSGLQCLTLQPRFVTVASRRTFCAGGLNSGQCLELGNSGASMAVEIGGKHFLHGIVSASFIDIAGCDNITFTLFTDVSQFETWINEIMTAS